MNRQEPEKIFCVPRCDLETAFGGTLPSGGFAEPHIKEVLSLRQHFVPRPEAEADDSLKQVIPYQVFTCNGRFFVFRRGGGVGEGRLAGRLSLGIGGHINDRDAAAGFLTMDDFMGALLREREEELVVTGPVKTHFIGWINDDSDSVGRVHLGAVFRCETENRDIVRLRTGSEDLHFVGWMKDKEIKKEAKRFEKWSLLAMESILRASFPA